MSSRSVDCRLRPRRVLVVDGAVLEAAVQDADESVGQLSQRRIVSDAAGALFVVVGPCSGEESSAANAWPASASMRRSLCTNRANATFFFPDALVIGEVPA